VPIIRLDQHDTTVVIVRDQHCSRDVLGHGGVARLARAAEAFIGSALYLGRPGRPGRWCTRAPVRITLCLSMPSFEGGDVPTHACDRGCDFGRRIA
jgi:hypothetical protein